MWMLVLMMMKRTVAAFVIPPAVGGNECGICCSAWTGSRQSKTLSVRTIARNSIRPYSITATLTTTARSSSVSVSSSLDSGGFTSTLFLLPDLTPLLAAAVALGLLIAAQSFINQMLDGDQGLGAFLKDGSGYQRSRFRAVQKKKETTNDPLPWLKLPQLDFVEVAGQERELKMKQIAIIEQEQQQQQNAGVVPDSVYQELEQLRMAMNRELQEENISEAKRIRKQLEGLMKKNGIKYTPSEEDAFQ